MPALQYLVDNHAGWRLAMSRRLPARGTKPASRPVLIVPGYGMNSYIFGFHPRGPSMVDCFSARGLEVWTVDLRGQGRSIRARGNNRYGLAELAIEDLGAAIAHVLANTETGAKTLDIIGCSLGTALSFAHVASVPDAPVHALVSMAGLVTWKGAHPLVRFAFGSPRLVGLMRVRNTRQLARFALPVVARVAPSLLSVYLNHQSTDLTQAAKMVQTVEDPHPIINREIAQWIKRGDLVVRGVNVSQKLPSIKNPFFCVVANDDGIVLPVTSRHTYDVIGSETKRLLLVGDPEQPIAHADLFLCTGAQQRIFAPIADFLLEV
ncbi:MAG: Polyhydroxyalkanoic acid synthase [Labilithrix sp.]|nr:Polyhydroxyalkanoic acid synthase [Labilithrix sp.]